jgi:hypothetical protein
VEQALIDDGCTLEKVDWSGTAVLLGWRSDFRFRWLATKLHLFVVIAERAEVTESAIESFTDDSLSLAQRLKPGLPVGLQTGIAVLAALVTERSTDAAHRWAVKKQRVRFGCSARPVIVDLSQRQTFFYAGTPLVGALYSGHLREKVSRYFPYVAGQV